MIRDVLFLEHAADRPPNDFRLIRLCEWAGFALKDFPRQTINDTATWRPPGFPSPKVVFSLGPRVFGALGLKGNLLQNRGYIHTGPGYYIVPSNGPGFIQRGNAKWSAAFINDLQKAVTLAEKGMPPQVLSYVLDPSPLEAYHWAQGYRAALDACGDPSLLPMAFDIETPGKGEDEDDLDVDSDAPDRTWNIERIGFSYAPLGALSIPWAPEYMAAITMVLASAGDKVVWNAGFDVPRIRRVGVAINGLIHDGMIAWHILHTDLPKKLSFVATFTCPWQPAWKHLSGAKPAFYNATDADVELRSWLVIKDELQKVGLWEVYDRDVLQLEPILAHMHEKGMPVDLDIRLDRARKLSTRLFDVRAALEAAVPLAARRIEHVYKNEPKDKEGLSQRPSTRQVLTCTKCGAPRPRKDHFRILKKSINPCAQAGTKETTVDVTEYYRLSEFSPSRDQLVRYHQWLKRPLPTVWDKRANCRRVSFGERAVKDLIGKYPLDPLYPLVLQYRSLEKIAGTYIGRPLEV